MHNHCGYDDDYDDSGYSVEDEDDDGDVISGASGQL